MTNINKSSMIIYSIKVDGANPNGDPNCENYPRVKNGIGYITNNCLTHKIRRRLFEAGERVYYYSENDNVTLASKMDKLIEEKGVNASNKDETAKVLRENFIDLRLFGGTTQTLNGAKKGWKVGNVFKHPAISFMAKTSTKKPVDIETIQNSCCVDLKKTAEELSEKKNKEEGGSTTFGITKHVVNDATYFGCCFINRNVCESNDVTQEDVDKFLKAFRTMFVNDVSSARPEGSMKIDKIIRVDFDANDEIDSYDMREKYLDCFDADGKLDEDALKNAFPGLTPVIIK